MTQTERIIAGLQAAGWTEIEGRTSKARTFTKPGQADFFFVGRAGSLRFGPAYTTSWPAEKSKAKLLAK